MYYECVEVIKIQSRQHCILMWVGYKTLYSGQSSTHRRRTGLGWAILDKTELDRTDLG